MKIAPLMRAFEAHPAIGAVLVHTGQDKSPTRVAGLEGLYSLKRLSEKI